MRLKTGALLNLFEGPPLADLPEGFIIVDSILFILIATLLIYTFIKSKTGDRNKVDQKNTETNENGLGEYESRDILMQPKDEFQTSDSNLPFSNFSTRKAFFWLLGLFVLFNVVYVTLK